MILYIFGLVLKTVSFLLGIGLVLLIVEKTKTTFFKCMCKCKVDLSEKIIVITGGNTGLGFETAKTLAKRGARIIIASRDVVKSQAAVQAIIDATGNPNIEQKPLDLTKLSSIKQFADDFNRSFGRLDVLINNAGMGERKRTYTEDRIDTTFQINHVGPTYLTQLLLDKLIASKPSRIIFVSSGAHYFHNFDPNDIAGDRHMNFWIRYATTKLCNILVARALSEVVPEGVTVNSLHPGMANTEIWKDGSPVFKKILFFLIDNFMKTNEECAQTAVHLAMAPALARVTGQYFDMLKVAKPDKAVTDELARKYYQDTLQLIEDRVKC